MRRHALIAALMLGSVACGAAAVTPAVPAAGLAPAADGIPWSAARRLRWSDFLGRPDFASEASATTAYVIGYESVCDDGRFTFAITNVFKPERSWVKPALLVSGAIGNWVLQHEQTHFDLAEVHARELRRALSALRAPCERPSAERTALVERHLKTDEETQRRYDEETASGVERGRQRDWETAVARKLAVRP